jgi:ABC-type uncharacterized transport system involved in gliding motility auxiliary subunit
VALMATAQSKAKTGANAVIFTILILAVVVFVNIIGSRHASRFDLTKEHVYTLSSASKQLVKNLPDKMTVKAYISGDLQPPFSQTATYVRDLLDEYANASQGKLKWEAIDPGEDPKLEEEAQKNKVPRMQRGKISNNKVEIGASYLGVALQYAGNVESIPEINSPEGLEFEIDKRMRILTQKKIKIGFATSEGELPPNGGQQGGLGSLTHFLDIYEVVNVNLSTGAKPLADDVEGLIIAGPKQAFSERAKFVIDQFIMRGKAVAFFVDGMTFEAPQQMHMPGQMDTPKIGRKNDCGLDDLLAHYGFKINDDVILEPERNAPGVVVVGGQPQLANYPAFVATDNVAKASPLFNAASLLILPFPSSVEVLKDKQSGLAITQLASSSSQSWRQKGFFLVNPTVAPKMPEKDAEHGPFVLGYSAEGKFKSFFAGKPYPNEKGEKVQPPPANVSLEPGQERPIDEGVAPARLVVMGDSSLISDEYLMAARYVPAYKANLLFGLNVIDYVAHDKQMAEIRAKGMTPRTITYDKESTPILLQALNVVGVPLLFIFYGVLRWRWRTARRSRSRL